MTDAKRIPDLEPLTDGVVTLRPWTDDDAPFVARATQATDDAAPR
jgi:hypothetical protein